jgi:transcriptional regulator with XRE-family HTH domain
MARPYRELQEKMSPASRAEADRLYRQHLQDMLLSEIRRAQGLTQVEVAKAMGVEQASVSKIEHQTDLYISTLRKFIKACGGDLRIVVDFPQGSVALDQF